MTPWLRLTVFVNGEPIERVWVNTASTNAETAELIEAQHMHIVTEAHKAGNPWMVELFDPDKPEATAYVRFGTDNTLMLDPAPLNDVRQFLEHVRRSMTYGADLARGVRYIVRRGMQPRTETIRVGDRTVNVDNTFADIAHHIIGEEFTCPVCGRSGRNPSDAAYGYCGNCHDYTGRPQ